MGTSKRAMKSSAFALIPLFISPLVLAWPYCTAPGLNECIDPQTKVNSYCMEKGVEPYLCHGANDPGQSECEDSRVPANLQAAQKMIYKCASSQQCTPTCQAAFITYIDYGFANGCLLDQVKGSRRWFNSTRGGVHDLANSARCKEAGARDDAYVMKDQLDRSVRDNTPARGHCMTALVMANVYSLLGNRAMGSASVMQDTQRMIAVWESRLQLQLMDLLLTHQPRSHPWRQPRNQ